jgi:two-component sensor histidine kinase
LARRHRRKSDGGHLRQIIRDLEPTVAPSKIQFDATEAIRFAADRAILVGLIINELVSNAGKYAYPNRARWFDLGAG